MVKSRASHWLIRFPTDSLQDVKYSDKTNATGSHNTAPSQTGTWPNSEFRLLAMTSRTEERLVRSTTSVFLTKSCQRIPRIIRWQRMGKASSFRRSSCRSVHVSEPYNKIDSIHYTSLVQAKFCLQLKPSLSPDFVHRLHGRQQKRCQCASLMSG